MKTEYKASTDPYIAVWLAIVAVTGLMSFMYSEFLRHAFHTNPALNSIIWASSGFGVLLIARHIWMVAREKRLLYPIEAAYKAGTDAGTPSGRPALVADLFRRLDTFGMFSQEAETPESVVEHELDYMKGTLIHRLEPSEFLAGAMVGLGLLGTFIGLLDTLVKTSDVIASIAASVSSSANLTEEFRKMVVGLQGPLAGMGTAFSASLFGLLASMILGLMILVARGNAQDLVRRTRSLLIQHNRVTVAAELGGQSDETLRPMLAALMTESRRNAAAISRLTEESRRSAETVTLLSQAMEGYASRMEQHAMAGAELKGNLEPLQLLPQSLERLATEAELSRHAGKVQEAALNNAVLSLYRINESLDRQCGTIERMEANTANLLRAFDGSLAMPVAAGLKQADAKLGGLTVLLERHLGQNSTALDLIAKLQRDVQLGNEAVHSAMAQGDARMIEKSAQLIAAIEKIGSQVDQWSTGMAETMSGLARHGEDLRSQRNLVEQQIQMDQARCESVGALSQALADACERLVESGRHLRQSFDEYRRAVPHIKENLRSLEASVAKVQVGMSEIRRAVGTEEISE